MRSDLLGATAGVLDIWGSHVGDSHVTGIRTEDIVTATHHGDDYGKATDKATGREVVRIRLGDADLAQKGLHVDNLKKVTSGDPPADSSAKPAAPIWSIRRSTRYSWNCSCKW